MNGFLRWSGLSLLLAGRLAQGMDGEEVSNLKADEQVILFPSYAWQTTPGQWSVRMRAWVFEPRSVGAASLEGLLAKILGRRVQVAEEERAIFQTRARPFLVDNERRKRLVVDLLGRKIILPPTGPNGHSEGVFPLEGAWTGFERTEGRVVLPASDPRSFLVNVEMVQPGRLVVISDIDDTVKETRVADFEHMIANTFFRPARAVAGMPELYARLKGLGASFHYVSNGPWHLYPTLSAFLHDTGYPSGSLHLAPFRVKDASGYRYLRKRNDIKRQNLETIFLDLAQAPVVLIGDSGESDPEIYGEFARRFPSRVRLVLIRAAQSAEAHPPDRMAQAFRGVAVEKWAVFSEPADVIPLLARL